MRHQFTTHRLIARSIFRAINTALLLLLALTLLSSCGDNDSWSDFETYPGAINLDARELGAGQARQLSFYVDEAYPFGGVIDHYEQQIKAPWKLCSTDHGWTNYIDAADGNRALVHQSLRYWANHDLSRLLILAVSYRSENIDNHIKPDNKRQQVILVEYRESNLAEALKRLNINC